MKPFALPVLLIVILFSSCKKAPSPASIEGQWIWVIQYSNNPFYNTTPQNTGIQEKLIFSNGIYTVTQNNSIVNTGTYKTTIASSANGGNVASVLYSNIRVKDSADYYMITNSGDSLQFSHDLIGTIGAGSRHYGKQ